MHSHTCSGYPVEDADIHDLGKVVALMMTAEQLEAAAARYHLTEASTRAMTVPLTHVRRVMYNHWRNCVKMPAGGAHAGGSMQTGFEMELITASAVRELFRGWPNYELIKRGHTWEARTMEECELALCFEASPAGWGVGNAKPAPLKSGKSNHSSILMVGPPLTVTWRLREDATSNLAVRCRLGLAA